MSNRDREDPARRTARERSSATQASAQVEISDAAVLTALAGPRNEHLRTLETETGVAIGMRGNQIHLQGAAEDVAFVERTIAELVQSLQDGNGLTQPDVARAVRLLKDHPDVKLRRKPADLPKLAAAQARLLSALWPLLQPGGKLLYVTCSILPEENENTVRAFLAHEVTATEEPLPAVVGRPCTAGRQILPGERGMDGFYYACLQKK